MCICSCLIRDVALAEANQAPAAVVLHRTFAALARRRGVPCRPAIQHKRARPRDPSGPHQDTLQQLLNTLKGSDALLDQNHGALAAALAELDPAHHSLGYLYLL